MAVSIETREAPGPPVVWDAPRIDGLRFWRYRGPADDGAITAVMHAGRRADGVQSLPSAGEMALELGQPANEVPTRDLIVVELGDRVVAFARAHWSLQDDRHAYITDCEVHPDVRRRGIGRALLHTQQARLHEIAATHPTGKENVLQTWIIERPVGARALFDAEGYRPIRYFVDLHRSLDEPLPDASMPPGFEIRPVTEQDHHAIFDAEAEAFRDHWGHREWTPADFVQTFEYPGLDTSMWRVAWAGDEVAGVVETFVYGEENATLGVNRGSLERISVRRPWRRRGLARALIVSAMVGLRERGISEATLDVDADNPTGALQLYEGLGVPCRRARRDDGAAAGGAVGLSALAVFARFGAQRDDSGMHRRAQTTAGLAVALVLAGCSGTSSPSPSLVASVPFSPSPAPSTASPSPSEAAMSPSVSPSSVAAAFGLSSTAFEANSAIPAKYTCDGKDVSPPLAWTGTPAGAAALAIVVTDPDANGFVHWVAWDIDAAKGTLAEGASGGSGLTEGRNSFGKRGWSGPCPPSGTHHYVFELYALDQRLGLPGGTGADQVRSALSGHKVGSAKLTATYKRG
jgi:mycothiol synthase